MLDVDHFAEELVVTIRAESEYRHIKSVYCNPTLDDLKQVAKLKWPNLKKLLLCTYRDLNRWKFSVYEKTRIFIIVIFSELS